MATKTQGFQLSQFPDAKIDFRTKAVNLRGLGEGIRTGLTAFGEQKREKAEKLRIEGLEMEEKLKQDKITIGALAYSEGDETAFDGMDEISAAKGKIIANELIADQEKREAAADRAEEAADRAEQQAEEYEYEKSQREIEEKRKADQARATRKANRLARQKGKFQLKEDKEEAELEDYADKFEFNEANEAVPTGDLFELKTTDPDLYRAAEEKALGDRYELQTKKVSLEAAEDRTDLKAEEVFANIVAGQGELADHEGKKYYGTLSRMIEYKDKPKERIQVFPGPEGTSFMVDMVYPTEIKKLDQVGFERMVKRVYPDNPEEQKKIFAEYLNADITDKTEKDKVKVTPKTGVSVTLSVPEGELYEEFNRTLSAKDFIDKPWARDIKLNKEKLERARQDFSNAVKENGREVMDANIEWLLKDPSDERKKELNDKMGDNMAEYMLAAFAHRLKEE